MGHRGADPALPATPPPPRPGPGLNGSAGASPGVRPAVRGAGVPLALLPAPRLRLPAGRTVHAAAAGGEQLPTQHRLVPLSSLECVRAIGVDHLPPH